MGEQRARHRPPPVGRADLVVAPTVLAGVALLSGGGALAAVASAAVGVLYGLGVRFVVGRIDSGVTLYANGLVVFEPKRAPREIFFDDVDLVFGAAPRIALTTHDGARIVLPAVERASALAAALKRECSLPLVAPVRTAFSEGEPLRFGQLAIDREGATIGDAHRGWSEIARVGVAADRITFYEQDGRVWQWLGLATLPHLPVLVAVLGDVTRVQRRVSSSVR
jgi:hypothetical protein